MKDISIPGTPFAVICQNTKQRDLVIDFLNEVYPSYKMSYGLPSTTIHIVGYIDGKPTYDWYYLREEKYEHVDKIKFNEFFDWNVKRNNNRLDIAKETLMTALSTAITVRSQQEKDMGYTMDSGLVWNWKQVLEGLRDNKQINIIKNEK